MLLFPISAFSFYILFTLSIIARFCRKSTTFSNFFKKLCNFSQQPLGDGSNVPFLALWYRILWAKSWMMLVAACWRAAATMYPSLEFPYEFIPKYTCRHRSATRLEIRSRYIGRAAVTLTFCKSRFWHVTRRYPFCSPFFSMKSNASFKDIAYQAPHYPQEKASSFCHWSL